MFQRLRITFGVTHSRDLLSFETAKTCAAEMFGRKDKGRMALYSVRKEKKSSGSYQYKMMGVMAYQLK